MQDVFMGWKAIFTPSKNSMPSIYNILYAIWIAKIIYSIQLEFNSINIETILKAIGAKQNRWFNLQFFIVSNISFNTVKSHLFWEMIKNATQIGPTYDHHSYEIFRTKGVERSKARVEERVKFITDSWEVTSCTLVGDGWVNWKFTFLVYIGEWFIYPPLTIWIKQIELNICSRYQGTPSCRYEIKK